ncbi:hypothetical protein [Hungatella effluvii]|uniref:hypothetical protein n=1 Tax=Hungatella effluvii TaxID=1096246 RepID=UPI002A80DBC8|nr:hypothetical protein [Hungatella effluvii]
MVKSKFPNDLGYITSAIPRINDFEGVSNDILGDILWMITEKGIKSGEFGFANCTYTDSPDALIKWGYTKYFQHADGFVTVNMYPENTQNVFYRRFNTITKKWDNNWWKTQLVEIK